MFKLDLEKVEGTRDQIANIRWVREKAKELKTIHFCFTDHSLWLCGSQQTGKFWKRWEYQNTLPASWETCMQVKKQQLEPDMEQQTDSKLGKKYTDDTTLMAESKELKNFLMKVKEESKMLA